MTDDEGVPVVIDGEVDARATGMVGDRLTLRAPQAYAPGQPVRLALTLPERSATVSARSRGSRRVESDGPRPFEVTVRLVDLRRDDRRALEAALAG